MTKSGLKCPVDDFDLIFIQKDGRLFHFCLRCKYLEPLDSVDFIQIAPFACI